MQGKLIPSEKICCLPLGTKLLVRCLDENFWLICKLVKLDNTFYLYDPSTEGNLTEVKDLDGFCEVFEYTDEDARILIKKESEKCLKRPRYVFDKNYMAILDTEKNHIVCIVETKRPDLLEIKLNELLELANK